MRNIHKALFTFLFALVVHGAWAQADSSEPAPNYDSVLARLNANQTGFKTLALRASLTWDDGASQQEFQASIRIRRDSLIWLSLTGAMGIEGARVVITPDTFKMVNKLMGQYDVRPFSFISNWLMFPVSFNMLQQLLAGEKIDIREKAGLAQLIDSNYVLYSESDKMHEEITLNNTGYTPAKLVLKDRLLKQQLTLTFTAYNNLNGKPFAYTRAIEINRDSIILKLDMEITKVRVNEDLSFPFEVPDKLKRIK